MTPRRRIAHRLKRITEEVTRLRAKAVNGEILSTAKDEAMRDYINERIAAWNEAIRATNGPKRGETPQAYQARLLEANATIARINSR